MSPEMEKLLAEAVVVLLRHSQEQLGGWQPYNFPLEQTVSHEWKLAERIQQQIGIDEEFQKKWDASTREVERVTGKPMK